MAQLCKLRAVKNASYKLAPQATDFMSNRANHNCATTQTKFVGRFCEALLRELEQLVSAHEIFPSTIYFGGGTPTALIIAHSELLLSGFHERLDLSQLVEWTMEANPGSVSARKAGVLKKFGVNR